MGRSGCPKRTVQGGVISFWSGTAANNPVSLAAHTSNTQRVLGYAPRLKEQRPETHDESVGRGKIWRPSSGACDNQQLLLEQEVFGNDGPRATRAE